jgi:hypothetical protein
MPIAISQKTNSIHQKKEESNISTLLNSGEVHRSLPTAHAAEKHRATSVGDTLRSPGPFRRATGGTTAG